MWDLSTGKLFSTLIGHRKGVNHLIFDKHERKLVATDFTGAMLLWDLDTGKAISTLGSVSRNGVVEGTPIGRWAVAPDLKMWAVGAGNDVQWLDISDFTGK